MTFKLPELPYSTDALAPHISQETLDFHYGALHRTYVTNLNNLVAGTDHEGKPLEEIIRTSSGPLYNNAAQVWNHTFYWSSLSPSGGGEPNGAVKDAIVATRGSFDTFKQEFTKRAAGHFGSGWAWLVLNRETHKPEVIDTHDADTPALRYAPLLVCDVWEHAYYIDYRNARAKYVDSFWNVVNWELANKNLADTR